MFQYDDVGITYWCSCGMDGGADVPYDILLKEREAKAYTKARMLGDDLDEVKALDNVYGRVAREIISHEKSEYGTDVSDFRIGFTYNDNNQQPDEDDVREYLKDLLTAHRIKLAHDVVVAQIKVYCDDETGWQQIALDIAAEVGCKNYIKRFKDEPLIESE